MQRVGDTKFGQSTCTYRITEHTLHQDKSNRMIYNPTENPSQVVYVNREFQNGYKMTASSSQKKKKLHVHFAEPLVTYQYFNSEGLITNCPADKEKLCLEENLDQLHGAKQKYDTELIGVRKLVNELPSHSHISGLTMPQKFALLKRLEDLGEAVERSQKAFEAELEAEREKNRLLKQKMRKRKVSHNKECLQFKTELLNAKMLAQSLQGQLAEEIHSKNTLIMYFKELAAVVSSSPHNSTERQIEREEEQDHFKVLCKRNRLRYDTDPGSGKQQDPSPYHQQAFWPKDLLQEELQTTSSEAKEDLSEMVCFTPQDCQQNKGAAEVTEAVPSLWNAIWYIVGLWRPLR